MLHNINVNTIGQTLKIIALLFAVSTLAFAADTLSVPTPVVLKSVSAQSDRALEMFNQSLSAKQIRLRESMLIIEGQKQAFELLANDTIKVKR